MCLLRGYKSKMHLRIEKAFGNRSNNLKNIGSVYILFFGIVTLSVSDQTLSASQK